MAVQRGIGTVIFSIIGIVIVVVAVIIILKVMRGEPPYKALIYKSMELRQATDSLEKSKLISDIDELVAESDSSEVTDQWDRMMKCLSASCPDEAFLDMALVTVAAFEQDISESALLINIIATAKYWGDAEHLLDFSKAMSIANDQIDTLDNRKAQKAWEQIISCNNTCPEKHDLYFELIRTIVQ